MGNMFVSGVSPPFQFRHWLQSLCETGSYSLEFSSYHSFPLGSKLTQCFLVRAGLQMVVQPLDFYVIFVLPVSSFNTPLSSPPLHCPNLSYEMVLVSVDFVILKNFQGLHWIGPTWRLVDSDLLFIHWFWILDQYYRPTYLAHPSWPQFCTWTLKYLRYKMNFLTNI